jgi:AraC-like DNA-binding protein
MLIGRVPPPPLSSAVHVLWYADLWKPAEGRQRHMPDGSVNLIIALNRGRTASDYAIFSGPRSLSSIIDTSHPATLIGVHFKQGWARTILDLPLTEITNQFVTLADLARSGPVLCEQLLEADDAERRLDRLQLWLTDRVLRRPAPEPAVAWAVRQIECRPSLRVGAIAEHIGRSSRWFTDCFADHVGLTPKVFSRVQRFQLALRRLHGDPDPDLAEVGLEAGFFDQAHFVHDFRAISGMTPSEYLVGRTEHLNHVAFVD